MGRRQRYSEFIGFSDEEVRRVADDPKPIPPYTDVMASVARRKVGERYRLRTWLRGKAPAPLIDLFRKGRKDCGHHEWYRATDALDRCYHCDVGERPHQAIVSPVDYDLREAADRGSVAAAGALARLARIDRELGRRISTPAMPAAPPSESGSARRSQRR